MTDNPWTRLARRVAYENPWITVWHDDVLRPDGRPGVYGVVHYRGRAGQGQEERRRRGNRSSHRPGSVRVRSSGDRSRQYTNGGFRRAGRRC